MSTKMMVNLDMDGNSILNLLLNPLATAPEHAVPFYVYTSTAQATKGTIFINIGTYETPEWKAAGSVGALVTSVNGETGDVTLDQDDIGDGSTYVRTHNDLTDILLAAIGSALQPSDKGAANGVASLDSSGKVPSSQLPSYVDDVIEGYYYNGSFYEDSSHTTAITPSTGKIYVDLSTNKSYRWSGSVYVEISQGTVVTHATGSIGISNTSASVSYSGTLINAYAEQNGEMIICDINIGVAAVTFTVAAAPSTPITCHVVSI